MNGKHWLLDIKQADSELLDNAEFLLGLLTNAAILANLKIVGSCSHKFHPQGFSAVLLLSESHISIHTAPETSTAYIDLFSCKSDSKDYEALEYIMKELKVTDHEIQLQYRNLV